jgi:hypothetical protein
VQQHRSNFKFITPFTSDQRKWTKLRGINLIDRRRFKIEMVPSGKQDAVVPESFRIILRQYFRHPESKSLAPDGAACTAETQGLLARASIVAGEIVPVGKETDHRWGRVGDSKVLEYRQRGNMVIADPTTRDEIVKCGVRESMRRTGLSQHTLEAICGGKAVRRATLQRVVQALARKEK